MQLFKNGKFNAVLQDSMPVRTCRRAMKQICNYFEKRHNTVTFYSFQQVNNAGIILWQCIGFVT